MEKKGRKSAPIVRNMENRCGFIAPIRSWPQAKFVTMQIIY